MVLNVFIYTALIALSFYAVNKNYNSRRVLVAKKPIIRLSTVFVLTALFTLYNVFVTMQGIRSNNITGDRLIYSMDFAGQAEPGTVGLKLLIAFIRKFTDKSAWLFYGSTCICVLITFISYRKTKAATPVAILFLVLTQWLFCTIVNIKQCYCVAFATLFFVFAFKRRNLGNTLLCWLFIILATLFHESGYILIFVYFAMRLINNPKRIKRFIWFCAIVAVLFVPLMLVLIKVSAFVAPSLSAKLAQYFTDYEFSITDTIAGALKGLPFFYITVIGVLRQKSLSGKIKNYNAYLTISIIASLVYVVSIYNEWLFRLIYIFYFPIAIYWGQIVKHTNNKNVKLFDNVVVLGGLAVVLYRYIILMYVNYGGFSGIY